MIKDLSNSTLRIKNNINDLTKINTRLANLKNNISEIEVLYDDNKIEGSYNPPDPGLYKEISKDRGAIPSIISENSEFKGNININCPRYIFGNINII